MLLIMQILFIFMVSVMLPSIVARVYHKQEVSAGHFALLGIGITGVIVTFFLL